jgi:hypothetical protein
MQSPSVKKTASNKRLTFIKVLKCGGTSLCQKIAGIEFLSAQVVSSMISLEISETFLNHFPFFPFQADSTNKNLVGFFQCLDAKFGHPIGQICFKFERFITELIQDTGDLVFFYIFERKFKCIRR